jgi:hypothetical protein
VSRDGARRYIANEDKGTASTRDSVAVSTTETSCTDCEHCVHRTVFRARSHTQYAAYFVCSFKKATVRGHPSVVAAVFSPMFW